MTSSVLPTYARLPVTFERGEGAWLWDHHGKRYFDALSGIAVCSLGHAHPAIRDALCDQAGKLIHTSNLYHIDEQQLLADRLTALSGMASVFFCNSGAEANEAALKIARRYGHQRNIDKPAVIVMENSFHGRTLATLSATGNPKIQQGFEPLVDGFVRAPFDDIDALEAIARQHTSVVALLVEPVQGEGGVRVPAGNYLAQLRALCDRHKWLLMVDEIQTGIARTGRMFAFQHSTIVPDVCTLAKALGNGVPIGACMVAGPASTILTAGTHGSTFGGNPLVCRAALSVLETIEQQKLVEQAARMGSYLLEAFNERLAHLTQVIDIRGKGMMIGIELNRSCGSLVQQALDAHLLINVAAGNTIRLLPPLIIDQQQADLLVDTLCSLIHDFLAGDMKEAVV